MLALFAKISKFPPDVLPHFVKLRPIARTTPFHAPQFLYIYIVIAGGEGETTLSGGTDSAPMLTHTARGQNHPLGWPHGWPQTLNSLCKFWASWRRARGAARGLGLSSAGSVTRNDVRLRVKTRPMVTRNDVRLRVTTERVERGTEHISSLEERPP